MPSLSIKPAQSRRTQTERRETAERKITEAATRLIADKGLSGLTLAAAGEMAGYSRGIASHHFGKKNELLISVINHIASRFNSNLKEKTDICDGLDMVYAVIDQYFWGVSNDSHITLAFQLIISEGMTNKALQPFISNMNEHAIKNLTLHIEHAINKEEIRTDLDPQQQATILIASLRGMMTLWLTDKKSIHLKSIKKEFINNLENNWLTST
ncbi:MAG: TetR/AcrR family transcriptional regulator [Cellvibrionaceae bacterium]